MCIRDRYNTLAFSQSHKCPILSVSVNTSLMLHWVMLPVPTNHVHVNIVATITYYSLISIFTLAHQITHCLNLLNNAYLKITLKKKLLCEE